MARVAVIGGGLAGIAAATALGSKGFDVHLLEARPFLGGRATSWAPNSRAAEEGGGGEDEVIDNCQHVLLRCCTNLLDLYQRLGSRDKIHFHKEFHFIEPGGRLSTLKRGMLGAPNHFAGSFLALQFLGWGDKLAIARAMRAIPRERRKRRDLDAISMLDWLREKRQPERAIERFWRQVLVSAINEELDRMAAAHGFQVFWQSMLETADAYEMGVPSVPLRQLYDESALSRFAQLHTRSAITSVNLDHYGHVTSLSAGEDHILADYYVSALPFEKLQPLLPSLPIKWEAFEHSPITGIHLWFDRQITTLPHATLLDRTIQWMFNKQAGRYLQLVVSASRSLTSMPRQGVIDLAVRELADFFPAVREAKLEKAQVIKEVRATFSARPKLETLRPRAATLFNNFFLAGDWTRSGWPATMEGAVRSGYLAAEAICESAGLPQRYLR